MSIPINILSRSFRLIFAEPFETIKVVSPGLVTTALGTITLLKTLGGLDTIEAGVPQVLSWQYFLAALALCIAGYVKFAVCWHRHALLQGGERGSVMSPGIAVYGQYLMAALVVACIILVIALIGGIGTGFLALGISRVAGQLSVIVAFALFLVLAIGLSWLMLRISLTLPATSTGHNMGYSESWQATARISRDIFWTAVLLGVINLVLEQLARGVTQAVPNAALPVFMLELLFTSLIYVSVLSTLYGHLVQGRSLD